VNVVHLGLGSLTEGEGLVYQFVWSAHSHIQNIIYLFYKTSYLKEEVHCTEITKNTPPPLLQNLKLLDHDDLCWKSLYKLNSTKLSKCWVSEMTSQLFTNISTSKLFKFLCWAIRSYLWIKISIMFYCKILVKKYVVIWC
jgi:hypothetical protein